MSESRELAGKRRRAALHALAFGTRSGVEAERDADPHYLILGVNGDGPGVVLLDDADRVPVFVSPRRAELAAEGLRGFDLFESIVVAPTWGNAVAEVLIRNRLVPTLAGIGDDEAEQAIDEALAHVYMVESVALGTKDADAYARELPARIVEGMATRPQDEAGLTGEGLVALVEDFPEAVR